MNDNKDGGSAFPVHPDIQLAEDDLYSGMSLRDWFAGQALAGLCANPELGKLVLSTEDRPDETLAECAYLAAGAMVKARTKAPKDDPA